MSFLVVAILSLLWLGFFLPSYLQTRQSSSPYASATTFQESMRRISESQPSSSGEGTRHHAPAPHRRAASRVSARRRDVLAGLSGLVVASALLAVSFQGPMMWAPIPAAAALVGYVVVLRARVVRSRGARRSIAPTVATVAPVLVPVAAEDGVIPSVRRRSEVAVPQSAEAAASEQLERVAG